MTDRGVERQSLGDRVADRGSVDDSSRVRMTIPGARSATRPGLLLSVAGTAPIGQKGLSKESGSSSTGGGVRSIRTEGTAPPTPPCARPQTDRHLSESRIRSTRRYRLLCGRPILTKREHRSWWAPDKGEAMKMRRKIRVGVGPPPDSASFRYSARREHRPGRGGDRPRLRRQDHHHRWHVGDGQLLRRPGRGRGLYQPDQQDQLSARDQAQVRRLRERQQRPRHRALRGSAAGQPVRACSPWCRTSRRSTPAPTSPPRRSSTSVAASTTATAPPR